MLVKRATNKANKGFESFNKWFTELGLYDQTSLRLELEIDKNTSFLSNEIYVKLTGQLGEVKEDFENCASFDFAIEQINTDPERFQNRNDAFSELSAREVAENFDPNKFDPIVIWLDPDTNQYYVLSGHSRLEGMKRRNAITIPVRIFEGSESKAIQFSRVDANRGATEENLIEDLKAYRLLRDGDEERGIAPVKKSEINKRFKGKAGKLENYSFLSENGLFIEKLSLDNKSEFPYLERFASWAGELMKKYPQLTTTHENDLFFFFYAGDGKSNRIGKEDFFKEVEKRVGWGKARLFPECNEEDCTPQKEFQEAGENRALYTELETIQSNLERIKNRLSSNRIAERVYTDEERLELLRVGSELEERQDRLRRDLNIIEDQNTLFGLRGYIFDFSKVSQVFLLYYSITLSDVRSVFNSSDMTIWEKENGNVGIVGLSKKSMLLAIEYEVSTKKEYDFQINEVLYADDEEKEIWCNG